MCSWLNVGVLDLCQQAAMNWLRDDHCQCVKMHAVIREVIICLSLLPHSIEVQIHEFMLFWSKTEITATAPICLPAWWLYWLTYGHICIPQWFMAAIKPIKSNPKILNFLQNYSDDAYSFNFVWVGYLDYFFMLECYLAHRLALLQFVWGRDLKLWSSRAAVLQLLDVSLLQHTWFRSMPR